MRSVGTVPITLLTAVVSLSAIGMAALAADPVYEHTIYSMLWLYAGLSVVFERMEGAASSAAHHDPGQPLLV